MPDPQSLRRKIAEEEVRLARIEKEREDRRPLASMLPRVIEDHPNCPLTHFRWVTLLFVHDPILSNDGVSSKTGAIHSGDRSECELM